MKRPLLVLALLTTLGAAGCGDDGGGGSEAVSAVATTTHAADILRNVGAGRVEVRTLLAPSGDPHDYEPRPSDARAIGEADLVVRSGGEVDEWLGELLDSAGGDAPTLTLIDSVRTRGDDPHWWQDPRNAALAAASIADALAEADAGGADAYRRAGERYAERLRRLDRAIAGCVARVPRSQRKLVTTHDALDYYAARYGFDVVGALIPSLSTQAQPSAGDTARLVEQIRDEGVRAIFPEATLDPKLERAVARDAGAEVGDSLWSDALGPEGSDGETYVEAMLANTDAIVSGLTGGEAGCDGRV